MGQRRAQDLRYTCVHVYSQIMGLASNLRVLAPAVGLASTCESLACDLRLTCDKDLRVPASTCVYKQPLQVTYINGVLYRLSCTQSLILR